MTYLWQELRGKKYYRVQTDDIDIAKKMKRRNGFSLIGYMLMESQVKGHVCGFLHVNFPDRILRRKHLNQ